MLQLPAFAIAIVSVRLLNTISRLPPRRAAMAVRDWTGVACLQGHLHLKRRQPGDAGSLNLLKSQGFFHEGLSKQKVTMQSLVSME